MASLSVSAAGSSCRVCECECVWCKYDQSINQGQVNASNGGATSRAPKKAIGLRCEEYDSEEHDEEDEAYKVSQKAASFVTSG